VSSLWYSSCAISFHNKEAFLCPRLWFYWLVLCYVNQHVTSCITSIAKCCGFFSSRLNILAVHLSLQITKKNVICNCFIALLPPLSMVTYRPGWNLMIMALCVHWARPEYVSPVQYMCIPKISVLYFLNLICTCGTYWECTILFLLGYHKWVIYFIIITMWKLLFLLATLISRSLLFHLQWMALVE
jgi:hypothetical protein